jgi:serine protease
MGFPAAWGAVGFGSTAVTVALVDSGILKTHEDLAGPRLLQGHDYVNNDSDPDDTCGHGTHTAGTVGATTNNSVGVAGLAQVRVLEMKALANTLLNGCSGNTDGIAQAIIDATDQGAKVISMSIGGGSDATLQNAVNYAADRGVILVAAAGNDGADNSVDYPAAYPNVIAVGALTSAKARASYSDGGAQLDIAAPGSSVMSTYTDSNSSYASMSGTSMATPHVAGAIALALGCAPAGTTSTQVVNALYATAEDLGPSGRDDAFGYGLARADRLVQSVCAVAPANHNPTAAFVTAASGTLGVAVDGSTSKDADGDALSYGWDFGDGAKGAGKTATHTYAAAGAYTITLTVNDGRGGTATTQRSFTATTDPDPGAKTITSGETVYVNLSSSAKQRYFKIAVPAGTTRLSAKTVAGACTTCPMNADLFTRGGARPTDAAFACRAATATSNETCTTTNPASGYWYMRVKWASGAGKARLTVTLS